MFSGLGLGSLLKSGSVAFGFNELSNTMGERRWKSRLKHMQSMGLTPQEIMGSGVGGAGATGGQTFGNMNSLAQAELQQEEKKKKAQEIQRDYDVANINADAIRDVAKIQTGQQDKALQVQKGKIANEIAIAWEKLSLDKQKWDIQKQTADPAFIIYKTALTMGTENLIVSGLYNYLKNIGYDILDPNGKISYKHIRIILDGLQAERARTNPEVNFLMQEIADGAEKVMNFGTKIGNEARDFARENKDLPNLLNRDNGEKTFRGRSY